jgi:predicted transcriptional regulator
MTTIPLSPQLAAELEQIASEQAVKPEKLLEEAVRTYLRGFERDKIKAEAAAFRTLHSELVKQYLGRYVAIHDGHVVDHDEDFQELNQSACW